MALILVLNIHGAINSSSGVRKAMTEMKVARRFSASVVSDDPVTVGALKLCKDYVAWTDVDKETLSMLLEKRGMVSTTKRLDAPALKALGFKDHSGMADKMMKDGTRMSAIEGLTPYFRLAPPKGGFKTTLRRQFSEKGVLGMNPRLGEIIRRMV